MFTRGRIFPIGVSLIKEYTNKEWLENKYLEEKLSINKIKEICGVSTSSIIYYWLKKLNIPTRSYSEANSLSHQTEEWKQKQRESHQGLNCYFYGKHHPEGIKQRISLANKGKIFSDKHRINISEALKGHIPWNKGLINPYSEEILKRMSEAQKGKYVGDKSSNWRGGITPLSHQIRCSFKYRQWRSDVFTRDDFTCQKCGQHGWDLNVHHIKPFSSIIQFYEITSLEQALECEELWNINNGVTLCKKCHQNLFKDVVKKHEDNI